jgi:hypothetical protein
MSNANRIYLKFEDLDWDVDQAIEDFAAALHGALVGRLVVDKEFRSQERDEKRRSLVNESSVHRYGQRPG